MLRVFLETFDDSLGPTGNTIARDRMTDVATLNLCVRASAHMFVCMYVCVGGGYGYKGLVPCDCTSTWYD